MLSKRFVWKARVFLRQALEVGYFAFLAAVVILSLLGLSSCEGVGQ